MIGVGLIVKCNCKVICMKYWFKERLKEKDIYFIMYSNLFREWKSVFDFKKNYINILIVLMKCIWWFIDE